MNTDEALAVAMKQVAQAKVAEALGGDVLGKMIDAVMSHKERNTYSNSKDKTEFEKIVDRLLEGAVTAAVRDYLATYNEQIKAAVSTAMKGHADKVATTVIDAFNGDDWRATLNIEIIRAEPD